MRPDVFALHQRQRARRTAQSAAHYACALEIHRAGRRSDVAVWIALAIGFCAAIAAALLT